MERPERTFQWQTALGTPTTVAGTTVTPESRALIVRLPFGGFVWNRPVAVLVEREGQTERIAIHDVTRILQVGLIGITVFMLIVGASTRMGRKEPGE